VHLHELVVAARMLRLKPQQDGLHSADTSTVSKPMQWHYWALHNVCCGCTCCKHRLMDGYEVHWHCAWG